VNRDQNSAEGRWAREIEHHRRIAENAEFVWNWESPSGRRRAERRAELFVDLGGLRPGCRALELGCGTGVFLEKTARSGATIHGLDLSDELLAKARARLPGSSNITLDQGNAEEMPYPAAEFDTVYGSSVLHHLDLDAALREIHRVLKPGGRMVFAEPNILNPQVALMFHLNLTKEYFGVSPDEMAFSRFRARSAMRRTGFSDIRVAPVDFLHPATPEAWLDSVARIGFFLERVPLVREIAQSFADEPVSVEVCCEDVEALAHRGLLHQAVENLTTNARKHAAGAGLTLRVAHMDDDKVLIEVADKGTGMTPSDAERALDRFYRASGSDGEGFGLGLSIVREVVSVMDGTLSIESRPNEGTTVSIVLASAGAARLCG